MHRALSLFALLAFAASAGAADRITGAAFATRST